LDQFSPARKLLLFACVHIDGDENGASDVAVISSGLELFSGELHSGLELFSGELHSGVAVVGAAPTAPIYPSRGAATRCAYFDLDFCL